MVINHDCVYYLGDRPCEYKRLCNGCPHYTSPEKRILIIKTAAAGDVLRTTSLLPALRKRDPDAAITWLTSPEAAPLLANNPCVNRVMAVHPLTAYALAPMKFDLIVSLDKEPELCGLATTLKAREKAGILLSSSGTPVPADKRCNYYFQLGLSDELKFDQNWKTYHALIAEVAGLDYSGEKPELFLTEQESREGRERVEEMGGEGRVVIGVNTGAGGSFASKMMSAERIVELVKSLNESIPDALILLLGGPDEEEKNLMIAGRAGDAAVYAGCRHAMRDFAAIVAQCRCVVTGDTLALHIAVATGAPVVALFGPTCEQEIDLFENGEKALSPADCSPCYRRRCDKEPYCMDQIKIENIRDEVAELIKKEDHNSPK